MRRNRILTFSLATILLLGVYVGHSLRASYVSDDGYIAFRYVQNLVNGQGIVYNPGERVEGYNNFLWIILLAAVSWVVPNTQLLHISQVLGIAFGALTILMVCRFSQLVHPEKGPLTLLAGAFLAVHSGFAAWATAGLETTLFALLVFCACYAYVRYLTSGETGLAVPLLFALAALTRPDAILFFGVTMAHLTVLGVLKQRRLPLRTIGLWLFAFSTVYLRYFFWRFSYYGYLLPNTFYAKVGAGTGIYVRGIRYLQEYVIGYGFFVFVPVLLLLFRKRREQWIHYFALLIGCYLAYIVSVGGDGLAFFRFVAYIAPLIYLLVQEGFIEMYRRLLGARLWPVLSKVTVALLVFLSLGFTMRQTVWPLLFPAQMRWYEPQSALSFPLALSNQRYFWFDNYFIDRQAEAAKWIESNAAPGTLIASTPAGSIAYHLHGHKVVDMLGLNDEYIAHKPVKGFGNGRAGHEKGDGKYVLSRSPDYILMGNVAVLPFPLDKESMAEKLILKSEHELWEDPEFHRRYELQCVRLAESGVFQYFTFFKKRAPEAVVEVADANTQ